MIGRAKTPHAVASMDELMEYARNVCRSRGQDPDPHLPTTQLPADVFSGGPDSDGRVDDAGVVEFNDADEIEPFEFCAGEFMDCDEESAEDFRDIVAGAAPPSSSSSRACSPSSAVPIPVVTVARKQLQHATGLTTKISSTRLETTSSHTTSPLLAGARTTQAPSENPNVQAVDSLSSSTGRPTANIPRLLLTARPPALANRSTANSTRKLSVARAIPRLATASKPAGIDDSGVADGFGGDDGEWEQIRGHGREGDSEWFDESMDRTARLLSPPRLAPLASTRSQVHHTHHDGGDAKKRSRAEGGAAGQSAVLGSPAKSPRRR